MVEYPSIQRITPKIIFYWEKRAKESSHPIFKARYSNLVWDFSEKITGQKPHYSIAQLYIDSIIEIAVYSPKKFDFKYPQTTDGLRQTDREEGKVYREAQAEGKEP